MANLISAQDLAEGDLFELTGLENASEETKKLIITKMIENVQARLLLRIDDLLDNEGRDEIRQLMAEDNDENIAVFLERKNINLAELTLQEALLAKQEVIQLISKLKE